MQLHAMPKPVRYAWYALKCGTWTAPLPPPHLDGCTLLSGACPRVTCPSLPHPPRPGNTPNLGKTLNPTCHLVAGVHHHHSLAQVVGQQARHVTQQRGFPAAGRAHQQQGPGAGWACVTDTARTREREGGGRGWEGVARSCRFRAGRTAAAATCCDYRGDKVRPNNAARYSTCGRLDVRIIDMGGHVGRPSHVAGNSPTKLSVAGRREPMVCLGCR